MNGAAIAEVTGVPPQLEARVAGQPKAPRPDVLVIAPATFNTINKLADGIADTYAHSTACEALGAGTPVVVVPMVNDRLRAHPALANSPRILEAVGVRLVDVQDGAGAVRAVASGTGGHVVANFDPAWITAAVGRPARSSEVAGLDSCDQASSRRVRKAEAGGAVGARGLPAGRAWSTYIQRIFRTSTIC